MKTENKTTKEVLNMALWAIEWMWHNMQAIHPNLQSHAMDIPANAIKEIQQHLSAPPPSKEVKSAEEIIRLRKVFLADNRIQDWTDGDTVFVMKVYLEQFQSTPISQKFIDFMKGFFVSEIIHMESQLRSYNTSPSEAEDMQEKIDAYGGFLKELSTLNTI